MSIQKKFYMLPEDIGFVIGTGGVTINNIKKTANAQG
jgi:predicted RNA-binding protein YlqC (UPF0109 family)